jgi:predicted RNA-binding Zn-ribbon protein involved in translation (DUF1610 family)
MKSLVRVLCPHCEEAVVALGATCPERSEEGPRGPEGQAPTSERTCSECGFKAECFSDRETAFARFRSFAKDPEVIVASPVRLGDSLWAVAHVRLLLA